MLNCLGAYWPWIDHVTKKTFQFGSNPPLLATAIQLMFCEISKWKLEMCNRDPRKKSCSELCNVWMFLYVLYCIYLRSTACCFHAECHSRSASGGVPEPGASSGQWRGVAISPSPPQLSQLQPSPPPPPASQLQTVPPPPPVPVQPPPLQQQYFRQPSDLTTFSAPLPGLQMALPPSYMGSAPLPPPPPPPPALTHWLCAVPSPTLLLAFFLVHDKFLVFNSS